MARILFCWELGTGLGHLVPLAAAGRAAEDAGHDVGFALRDLTQAGRLLDPARTSLYQAPFFAPALHLPAFLPEGYPDILHAIGYRNHEQLAGMIAGWHQIYASFEPDLIVHEHSPTAMLAANGFSIPQIGISQSGFSLPPTMSPMPNLRAASHADQLKRERDVTQVINQALDMLGKPGIESIADLTRLDARILLSIPELDPYAPRDDVEYWGPLEHGFGAEPDWPDCTGKRIFAYVTRFDTLDPLLEIIEQTRCPALVHVSGMGLDECERRSMTTVRLSPEMLDMRRVLDECALMIVHGGSMSASILLAGKPVLTLPLHLEHLLTATRIQDLGAGLNAPQRRPQGMQQKLHRLLNEPGFAESAAAIAAKYRDGELTRSVFNGHFDGRFTELVERILVSRQI
jgi:hypothetical protein